MGPYELDNANFQLVTKPKLIFNQIFKNQKVTLEFEISQLKNLKLFKINLIFFFHSNTFILRL